MRAAVVLAIVLVIAFLGVAGVGGAPSTEFNHDVVAVDLAGRQTNLTRHPAFDGSPAVARDGRIAFVSTRDGRPDIYVMNGDGRNVRRLTHGASDGSGVAQDEALNLTQASWSPRGERLAFDGQYWAQGADCMRLCTSWRVLVVDSSGGRPAEIARKASAPAWSPDGRRVAFQSGMSAEGAAETLTIARADGSRPTRVQAINGDSGVGPVWSPDGREVAFSAQAGVYLVGADGRRKRRLAPGRNPTWSPDGRRLAFIDNSNQLITMTRDGKRKRRVSRASESVVAAAWSPKGDLLAFVAGTPSRYGGLPDNLRLKTVRANGTRLRVLARQSESTFFSGRPIWTPNGKRILITVVS